MPLSRSLLVGGVVAAVGVAWYVFRPERAVLDRHVDEPPPAGATVVSTGSFVPRAHKGRGRVEVLQVSNGQRIARFSDFETQDGPDLAVYLLGAGETASRQDLARTPSLSLGALKGNIGAQNYVIPAGTNVGQYHAVVVWCRRFGVNFTTASLTAVAGP